MIVVAVSLFLASLAMSLVVTAMARRFAGRMGFIDEPGERKIHATPIPRNGGMGIFWGFAIPLVAGLIGVVSMGNGTVWGMRVPVSVMEHLPGMRAHLPLAGLFLLATFAIHVLGLLDDRKPMAAWPKLILQLAIAGGLVGIGEGSMGPGAFRILTFLGDFPSVGFWASVLLSVCWIVVLTNAFNFLDHMDGLSAGIAFICAAMFLVAALFNGQWFVAALLILFLGAVLGFLCFNFPPATIFMGDGGSMVLGFILSVLTIRTTYYMPGRNWYAVLMPLFVMAVPLYDFVIVCALRILRGRSPLKADTNHFSHRLTRHGFSRRSAVLLIYGLTLATGVTAPLLAMVDDRAAILLAGQLLATMVVVAVLERVGEHTT
ncbi:MAG: undecaprenyl/decaprenyl-phosphate alpha-N-acetylglucosaminyl 1-phosphate transferase [Phycisphaerales bacterium]|nr:undecaprenyl/decaprenyl-phosphate alpha-N-acetylglucosaminyl 1-phosphate transferase [Phycisphaerales bacterium]